MWDLVDPKWAGQGRDGEAAHGHDADAHGRALRGAGRGEGGRVPDAHRRALEDGRRRTSPTATPRSRGSSATASSPSAGPTATTSRSRSERGAPVAVVYPDADGCGTLLLPNSIAILKGAPHLPAAQRFVDWVLRPETERELAFSRSAQIPVRDSVARPDDDALAQAVQGDGGRLPQARRRDRAARRSVQEAVRRLKRARTTPVSRPLVLVSIALLVLAGLAPIVWMLTRLESADFAGDLRRAHAHAAAGARSGSARARRRSPSRSGCPFGFLVARTDIPGARFLRHAGLVPLLDPAGDPGSMTMCGRLDRAARAAAIVLRARASAPSRSWRSSARAPSSASTRGARRRPCSPAGCARRWRWSCRSFCPPPRAPRAWPSCWRSTTSPCRTTSPRSARRYNVYADEVFASWQSVHTPGKAVAAALPLLRR